MRALALDADRQQLLSICGQPSTLLAEVVYDWQSVSQPLVHSESVAVARGGLRLFTFSINLINCETFHLVLFFKIKITFFVACDQMFLNTVTVIALKMSMFQFFIVFS